MGVQSRGRLGRRSSRRWKNRARDSRRDDVRGAGYDAVLFGLTLLSASAAAMEQTVPSVGAGG